jgi:hypothetical protein
MPLSDIYLGLGEERFRDLLGHVSLGKLKTYQLFDRLKTRARLGKLNQENLRKSVPKLWARIGSGDDELATDLAQCVLVSHMDMIIAVLDSLSVPHTEGFFEKDTELKQHFNGDWQQRAFGEFRAKYPESVLTFYLNHLALEVDDKAPVYLPPAA